MKECRKCGVVKDDVDFYARRSGLDSLCKKCRVAYQSERKRLRKSGGLPLRRPGMPDTAPERFASKVQVTDDCWLWTGKLSHKGYGAFQIVKGRSIAAHRYSYWLYVAPIPEGMVIDHLCRNRACVRPDHLEVVDNRTNVLRGNHPAVVAYRTNICISGRHELVGDNVIQRAVGRMCRACQREAADRRNAERRAARAAAKATLS